MLEDDYKDILDWFLIQSKEVQKNAKIASIEETGPLLHIDKNVPKVFVPMFPRSAAYSENNTVARITVADTLVGCLIGYARVFHDFMDREHRAKQKDAFKGGYAISELPYKHCIVPNDKLVFDASKSGEKWLVNYNKESVNYKPIEIGKVFIAEINSRANGNKSPIVDLIYYIYHNRANGIKLTNQIELAPGYYRITAKDVDNQTYQDDKELIVEKITASEYEDKKKLSAALLEHQPSYLNW